MNRSISPASRSQTGSATASTSKMTQEYNKDHSRSSRKAPTQGPDHSQPMETTSRGATPHHTSRSEGSDAQEARMAMLEDAIYETQEHEYPEHSYPSSVIGTYSQDLDGHGEDSFDDEDEDSEDDEPQSDVVPRSKEAQAAFDREVDSMNESIAGLSLYPVVDKIGEGTFSSVYKAVDIYHNYYDNTIWTNKKPHPPRGNRDKTVYVALKRIYATSSPERIMNELEIMEDLRGCANLSYLITAFRTEDQIVAVMPYTRHVDFRDYYRTLDIYDIRQYMACLFNGLAQTHALNIIHRDVKPANFLYDPRTGQGTLCDFGLAERFDPIEWRGKCHHTCPTPDHPRGTVAVNTKTYSSHTQPGGQLDQKATKKTMGPPQKVEKVGYPKDEKRSGVRANRAGTRGFRAPEVLFKCQDQTAAVDIWSAGIILLSLLTRRFPMFNANTDVEALLELTVIFGKSKLRRCALLHNRTFHCTVPTEKPDGYRVFDLIVKLNPSLFSTPVNDRGELIYPAEEYNEDVNMALDLCRVCLHVDVTRRWTAEECLEHPFLRYEDV